MVVQYKIDVGCILKTANADEMVVYEGDAISAPTS